MAEVTTCKISASETIGALLARNASNHGSDIAVREKERGIWKESTWAEYAEEVLACAAGLEKIGVEPGKAVLDSGRQPCTAISGHACDFAARGLRNAGLSGCDARRTSALSLAKSKSLRPSRKIRNRSTRFLNCAAQARAALPTSFTTKRAGWDSMKTTVLCHGIT